VTTLFRLDASIRREGSVSAHLADLVENAWRSDTPQGVVKRRSVGTEPLSSEAWPLAVAGNMTDEAARSDAQRDAIALAASLASEVVEADAVVVATSLYNFGISQHLKAWVDLLITDPRLGPQSARDVVGGKPAVLVVARGGAYGAGTPREGWDHGTGWIRRILEDVWGLDLRIVEAEFTLVGVNPALDEFKEIAAQMRQLAETEAVEFGHFLARAKVS